MRGGSHTRIMVRGVTLFGSLASHASRGMASGTWPKPGRGARWVILAIHTCIGHLLRLKRASRRPQGQRSCDSSKLHPKTSGSGRGKRADSYLSLFTGETQRSTRGLLYGARQPRGTSLTVTQLTHATTFWQHLVLPPPPLLRF